MGGSGGRRKAAAGRKTAIRRTPSIARGAVQLKGVEYDRHVSSTLCSMMWLSTWSARAASLDVATQDGQIATAWIHVRNARPRLLDTLSRQGRLLGRPGAWYIGGGWPMVDNPSVLKRCCVTAVRHLSEVLGREAEFVASFVISPD